MMYRPDELFTIAGAADLLGIESETAARQVRRGRLQVVRTGDGKALVPSHEIDRYRREVKGKPGRKCLPEAAG